MRGAPNSRNPTSFEFVKLDLADRDSAPALFATTSFPHVVHLAAQAGVRHSLSHPHAYVDANLQGFANVLEGCRHNGCQHLLFASSSSVYGANTKLPFRASDNVDHPIWLYAASKKANELMAHSYAHLFRLPVTGLALLHGLRAVGPARHGDVDFRQVDPGRQADHAVQPRQDAARLHLCRRRRGIGGAADRQAGRARSAMVRRAIPIPRPAPRPGASTISATTIRSSSCMWCRELEKASARRPSANCCRCSRATCRKPMPMSTI